MEWYYVWWPWLTSKRIAQVCQHQLSFLFEHVTKAVDHGKSVDVIYLDFQVAFDKVPHVRLVNNVEAHGISDNDVQWIAEWLQGMQQRVVLNGRVSGWWHVLNGVPQGSILWPLLRIIFISDIDNGIVNKVLKFADYIKLVGIVSSPSAVEELQLGLKKLHCWSVDWQMLFNTDKCKTLHFYRATLCVSAVFSVARCLSVCLSVYLTVTFVYCMHRTKDITKLLSRHGSRINLVFDCERRYPIPRGTPSAAAPKHGGGWENLPFSTENPITVRRLSWKRYVIGSLLLWLLWNVNRKSKLADRSVSVPMTLSDLERRDARGQFFFRRISLTTVVPFDIERPNNSTGKHAWREAYFSGSATSLPQGGGGKTLHNFVVPFIYVYTFCRRSTKFHVVRYGEGNF